MKKIFLISMLTVMSAVAFTSCNTYKSASKTTGVSTQMLGKIGTVLLKDMGTMLQQQGMATLSNKISMGSKINTLIKGATMVSSFKKMLSGNYQIPMGVVEKAYGSFGTLQDVAGFIGKNANPSFLSGL